jgi:hypothetical protein
MNAPPSKLDVKRLADDRVRIVLAWESGDPVSVYLPRHLAEQLGQALVLSARGLEDNTLSDGGIVMTANAQTPTFETPARSVAIRLAPDTPGGTVNTVVVSEADLYRIIIRELLDFFDDGRATAIALAEIEARQVAGHILDRVREGGDSRTAE